VLSQIQAGPKPLAMYIYSDDEAFATTMLAGTSSGGVTVNGFASHVAEYRIPFGGVNNSGTGRYTASTDSANSLTHGQLSG
jgi:aldehyde dehydrogenase (NAD+)